jgi:hypothetical protein
VVFEGLLSFDMNNKLIQFVAHDADSGANIDVDTARDGEEDKANETLYRAQRVLESEAGGRFLEDVRQRSAECHHEEAGGSVGPAVGVKGEPHKAEAAAAAAAVGAEWLQLYSMVLSSALSTGEVRTMRYSTVQRSTEQCSTV